MVSSATPVMASAQPVADLAIPTSLPGSLAPAHVARIDDVVRVGQGRGDYPGAVVLVRRDGHTVFHRAYGARALEPARAAMRPDTLFDIASLTKPVATATAIMILRDRGKLALGDAVTRHLPACKLRITIESLLTHRSGLPAANSLKDYRAGRTQAVEAICDRAGGRRAKERYSDLGYILLAEVVARVSGMSFDKFCRDNIFEPLKMVDTGFAPTEPLRSRAAPTERRGGVMLKGSVHDPRAAALDGVAGHAGLFSTARDLGRWSAMLLGGGELDGQRVLSADAVVDMLAPRAKARRTLAMVRSVVGGFGHTGFTGTSLWLDPEHHTALVILASRLHPAGKGTVKMLRQDVRAVVLDANRQQGLRLGVDVLQRGRLAKLAGKNVALITNATGRTRAGLRTADLLHRAPNVKLRALFAPEHGMDGNADGVIGHGTDAATGVPIYSLYGARRRATRAQLQGVDTLVFDIQSVGARFYTYVTTLGYALETAAAHGIEIIVLDRPNPAGGVLVEGPVLEAGRESFVGYHRIPVRHGMTIGELALLFNAERNIGAKLSVVELSGWRRARTFAATGLPWNNPSPNILSPGAALLYPGLALLEMTNVSVGRGTDAPFMRIGAPWIDPATLIANLSAAKLEGLTFAVDAFSPRGSKHAGQACRGVRFTVTEPQKVRSVRLGIALAVALREHHRALWQTAHLITLLGHKPTARAILAGSDVEEVVHLWDQDLMAFRKVRKRYLLYK